MRFFKNIQFAMITRVALLLKRNKKLLCERVSALEELIDDFTATVESMHEYYRSFEFRKTRLQTVTKKKAKTMLIALVRKLINGVAAYAYHKKDAELFKKVNLKKSHLSRPAPEKVAELCKAVIDAAKSISTIRRYGVKAEDIAIAEKYYEDFVAVMHLPQTRKKERANDHQYLQYLLKECINALENEIDPLVELAGEDDFQLRYKYKEARKVFPGGQGRKSEKEMKYKASRKRKPRTKKYSKDLDL